MCYPLSRNYKENKKKALALALSIMALNPNIFILLAHNSTQYSEQIEKYRSVAFDIEIIKRVDMFIIGKPLDYEESSGSVWEYELAKHFRKQIVTSDYLLGYAPKPHLWNIKKLKIIQSTT